MLILHLYRFEKQASKLFVSMGRVSENGTILMGVLGGEVFSPLGYIFESVLNSQLALFFTRLSFRKKTDFLKNTCGVTDSTLQVHSLHLAIFYVPYL
jgi:hypothetical protein